MKIASCTYINMDHRLDKRNFINDQLISCPSFIPIYRFIGLNIADYAIYSVHNYINPGSQMHKGIIGCWMSHKNAIQNLLTNDIIDVWYLVLEDDIFIDPNFWNHLLNFEPPDDADMIFFDSSKQQPSSEYIIDTECSLSKIYTSWPIFAGTHCYTIKSSSLNKVYNILDGVTTFKDIDGYLFDNSNIIKYNYNTELIRINYNFQSDRLTPL